VLVIFLPGGVMEGINRLAALFTGRLPGRTEAIPGAPAHGHAPPGPGGRPSAHRPGPASVAGAGAE
jgi:hypothetical protein